MACTQLRRPLATAHGIDGQLSKPCSGCFEVVLALAIVASLFAAPLRAQQYRTEFFQWRGPHRDGRVELKPPKDWSAAFAKTWQIPAGAGHATPLISGNRAYLFAREGDDEVITALELRTGKVVYRQAYPAPYEMNSAAQAHGKGPKSTPVVFLDKLYTLGISGILTCRDARTGKELWQHEFAKQYKSTSPQYGMALSPLLDGGLCVVHVGGHNAGALTGFDADTGEIRWSWKEDGPAYTSPTMFTLVGRRQIVTQTQRFCVGLSPVNGELLWKIPFTTGYDQNIVTPVVAGNLVIFGGYQEPTFAIELVRAGRTLMPREVWRNRDIPMYMSSPVVVDDFLYGMTQRNSGQLFCANPRTGKVLWTGPPRQGDNASLLFSGDLLLVLTTGGELVIAKAHSKNYEELGRIKVAEKPVWAHPAIVDDKILVKDEDSLTLFTVQP
jgi:outer membrane protein assembly factor BamB